MIVALLDLPSRGAAAELVMFEEDGCPWCAVWNREIAPIYPKTAEGQRAPLRRVDLHGTWPADLPELKAVRYTPTFVLIEGGREIGRIQGYPGEDFFWGLLAGLIEQMDPLVAPQPASSGGQ
ncbi:transcriptional regulator [Pelagibius litoralis]|uniref:Transcriptional regulator n=2 Tax=Pelagibius litoralis TaxID=374515 RepID=A0A967KCL4_9PROT|nr:transcriptional regulator [Pelagibius litoralis]